MKELLMAKMEQVFREPINIVGVIEFSEFALKCSSDLIIDKKLLAAEEVIREFLNRILPIVEKILLLEERSEEDEVLMAHFQLWNSHLQWVESLTTPGIPAIFKKIGIPRMRAS